MICDEIIWEAINHQNCCFKIKTKTQNFCKNMKNVTGLCSRSSCPLANSHYATITEEEGHCYLLIKTIERTHMPNHLWKKIRLNANYLQALDQIDKYLEFWPKFLVHKTKQRLTKIMQYISRIQKLNKNSNPSLILTKKVSKKEIQRENKAKIAAYLEQTIERNIIFRLNAGIYGDIYTNFDATASTLDKPVSNIIHAQPIDQSDKEVTFAEELSEPEANLNDLEDTLSNIEFQDIQT